MAFLKFMKKRGEFRGDLDLDLPPKPPKMVEEDIFTKEPIDEELMPVKKKTKIKEELPELLPLPEEDDLDKLLPPLPEEEKAEKIPELEKELFLPEEETGEFNLPPAPSIKKEKKGFFSFLRAKKKAKELELPEMQEEFPEMPPLPEFGEEFPSIPPLKEETPLPELEEIPIEPVKPAVEKPLSNKFDKKPIKRFIAIDEFKQIQSNIGNIKGILKGTDDFFVKLEDVKNIEDRAYIELSNSLEDIQRKITFVDKTLFKE